jgi:lysophospholipase L1-like esterase
VVPIRLFSRLIKRLMSSSITMRRSQFEVLPKATGRVVFLGDSITEFGIWHEWFPELATLNRGVGGDTIGGVLTRLDTALQEPTAISLLIGTNDLSGFGTSHKVADIAAQMDTLLGRIKSLAPQAPLYINSVMPRSKSLVDDVDQLNRLYRDLAVKHGATWVDVWSALAAPDGTLRKDLTSDGIHLNGNGYRIWVDLLRPHLV